MAETNFNIRELDAGDGVPLNGDNPNDVFNKDNLLKIGLSEELASGLDGKTVGEFQDIVTNTIQSGQNVNLEMFQFAKELLASYNDTGYENDTANAVISTFEGKLQDGWPTKEVQGLAYDMQGTPTGAIEGKNGSPALPAQLQIEASSQPSGTGYFGSVTPTDRELAKIGM